MAGAADDPGDGTATGPSADGRTARRDRNREAVLDAVLELFREDAVQPTPDEVAARSGVSLRSVYRYFADMDALVRAAMARHLVTTAPLFAIDALGEGSLPERVARLVDQRLRLYEELAPMMRAAVLRARSNPLIADRLQAQRVRLLEQVEAMFAPELRGAGPDPAAAVDVLLGFESIDHLRRDRGFTEAEARRTLTRAVTAILG